MHFLDSIRLVDGTRGRGGGGREGVGGEEGGGRGDKGFSAGERVQTE